MTNLVVFNLESNLAESEHDSVADGVKTLLSRNCSHLGLRVKNTGLILAVARTDKCQHAHPGFPDFLESETALVTAANPVNHVMFVITDLDWMASSGIKIGNIIGMPIRYFGDIR